MRQALPYHFERRSKNHLDWLVNVIKSETYFQADSIISTNRPARDFLKNLESATQ
ncbi:hypothetical protein D778_00982 [Xanthomarina gelatinilytica]|uniref:Uncharacterized protein n=1 Tax=Xanthomarina gelatinilytica TaxID=1137281 RepID=M7MDQ5_9FLAO|nr:hypothetical protein [Xanthomarina gelatinilytica]EMQ94267.1 hypothetical protein D778_00982 [Xanthomarina gelatinilytica]